ncbi:MAG: hypothetical protein Q4Q27_15205, partial [Methanosarcina mazei]|nr:hypothetical protein [Methanosarcina mazei]
RSIPHPLGWGGRPQFDFFLYIFIFVFIFFFIFDHVTYDHEQKSSASFLMALPSAWSMRFYGK